MVVGSTPLVPADAPEASMAAGRTWPHISVRSINHNHQRTDFDYVGEDELFFHYPVGEKSHYVLPGHSRARVASPPSLLLRNGKRVAERPLLKEGCALMKCCRSPEAGFGSMTASLVASSMKTTRSCSESS